MKASLDFNKADLRRLTNDSLKKQIQFASARTLTDVAFQSREATQKHLKRRLNLTKDFLPRSVFVNKASYRDRKPEAFVGFLPRAALIGLLEEGGNRTPTQSRTLAVATHNVSRGKRGGITKGKRPKQILNRKNVFLEEINGTLGIWQRSGKNNIKLLYSLHNRTTYKPRQIDFFGVVEKVMRNQLHRSMKRHLAAALRTAKNR